MPTIQYDDYQNLIHKLSWSWADKINTDQEELFAEGNLVFCKIMNKWDESKGAFSTYLTICINNRFRNMASRRKEILLTTNRMPSGADEMSPEKSAEFWSEIHSLSPDAQDIIDIVLSGPSEIAQMGNLYSHLREAGYAWEVIKGSIKEIKSIFN